MEWCKTYHLQAAECQKITRWWQIFGDVSVCFIISVQSAIPVCGKFNLWWPFLPKVSHFRPQTLHFIISNHLYPSLCGHTTDPSIKKWIWQRYMLSHEFTSVTNLLYKLHKGMHNKSTNILHLKISFAKAFVSILLFIMKSLIHIFCFLELAFLKNIIQFKV